MSIARRIERKEGYALLTVLVIGLAAATSVLAVSDLALSTFRSEAQRKYAIELRNAAEAGVDYAISQLNTAAAARIACPIDDGAPHLLPNTYLLGFGGSPMISNQDVLNKLSVTMTLTQMNPTTTWANIAGWSSIYSPSLDSTKSTSTSFKSPPTTNIKVDSWRVLTVKAQYSFVSRYIRVVLQPRYDLPPSGKLPTGSSQSYFASSLLGNQGLNFNTSTSSNPLTVQAASLTSNGKSVTAVSPGPTASTASLPPNQQVYQYPLTLNTNEIVSIGPGTDIKGNVSVSSFASGQNATASINSGLIEGTLTSNGTFPTSGATGVLANPGPTITPGDNVLAAADAYNPATNPAGPNNLAATTRQAQGTNVPNTTPSASGASSAQVLVAPAQSINAGSLPTFTAGASTLAAGDYSMTTLDTSDTAQFPTAVTAQGTTNSSGIAQPVRLFIQDGANNSVAVNLNSDKLVNASPDAANFQIWYSGNRDININLTNGANFNGIIYAPNATVTTTGTGAFTGAMIAGTAKFNHQNPIAPPWPGLSGLNLRTDLTTGGASGQGLSYTYDPTTGAVLTGYKPVTWEEPQM